MATAKKNVIPMSPRTANSTARMSERKWGRDVMGLLLTWLGERERRPL